MITFGPRSLAPPGILLFFTLIAAFFVVPAFLGPPPKRPDADRPEGTEAGRPAGEVAREPAAVK